MDNERLNDEYCKVTLIWDDENSRIVLLNNNNNNTEKEFSVLKYGSTKKESNSIDGTEKVKEFALPELKEHIESNITNKKHLRNLRMQTIQSMWMFLLFNMKTLNQIQNEYTNQVFYKLFHATNTIEIKQEKESKRFAS